MQRSCAHCDREFTRADFVKEQSRGMEAERRACALEGVRFLYYRCPACSRDDIFVDVLPLPDEAQDDFAARREAREAVVRRLHDGTARAEAVAP